MYRNSHSSSRFERIIPQSSLVITNTIEPGNKFISSFRTEIFVTVENIGSVLIPLKNFSIIVGGLNYLFSFKVDER